MTILRGCTLKKEYGIPLIFCIFHSQTTRNVAKTSWKLTWNFSRPEAWCWTKALLSLNMDYQLYQIQNTYQLMSEQGDNSVGEWLKVLCVQPWINSKTVDVVVERSFSFALAALVVTLALPHLSHNKNKQNSEFSFSKIGNPIFLLNDKGSCYIQVRS